MENKGFKKGLLVGLLGGLILLVAFFWMMAAADVANLGQAADVFFKMQRFSYNELSLPKMVDGMIEGMVNSLEDPYSTYLDAEAYKKLIGA